MINSTSLYLFHNKHHPSEIGAPKIQAFITSTLGYDIHTFQELLGHKDAKTTMIYSHGLNKGAKTVRSPLDESLNPHGGEFY